MKRRTCGEYSGTVWRDSEQYSPESFQTYDTTDEIFRNFDSKMVG